MISPLKTSQASLNLKEKVADLQHLVAI
jgi:hypothetical protein